MKNVYDLFARLRFFAIALRHCVIKKTKYDRQYYRKLDLEDVNIKTQMVPIVRDYERLAEQKDLPILYKVSFVPFKVKIGSRFCDLFRSLGAPHFADIKTYRNEAVICAHYKLLVGSIKCRLSLYFHDYKLALIRTRLSSENHGIQDRHNILELLFGHRLPQRVLDKCKEGAFVESTNSTILHIEEGAYDCQVIAFDPYNLGVQRLAKARDESGKLGNCHVQNWYRKKFGTNTGFQSEDLI